MGTIIFTLASRKKKTPVRRWGIFCLGARKTGRWLTGNFYPNTFRTREAAEASFDRHRSALVSGLTYKVAIVRKGE